MQKEWVSVMGKVYITYETPFDYTDAETYGEIVFLCNHPWDLHNIKDSPHNARVLSDLRHKLKAYDPAQDWLVLSGSVYIGAAVFWLLGHSKVNCVRILRWDNRKHRYTPLHLQLPIGEHDGKDDRHES